MSKFRYIIVLEDEIYGTNDEKIVDDFLAAEMSVVDLQTDRIIYNSDSSEYVDLSEPPPYTKEEEG